MDEYITAAGDSFDGIAYKKLGNELMSSEIIRLNPKYCNVLIFGEGVSLKLPETVARASDTPPWEVVAP